MNLDHTTSTAPAGATTYLTRPGGRIGYDVAGTGPLMVLVPGLGDLREGTASSPRPCARRAIGSRALIFVATATATRRSPPTATRKPLAMWWP